VCVCVCGVVRSKQETDIICSLYTNICTNKYCKVILNYSDMFRCQYTIFRQFTAVLAKVMNY